MVPSHQETVEPSPAPAASPASGGAVTVAGIAFTAPAAWKSEPPSSRMRAAQFSIPGPPNERDGEFVVYYFGRDQGGSTAENIARWEGQFTDAGGGKAAGSTRVLHVQGLTVTTVTATGTYSSGMPMGPSTPEPNFALWGAIVEGPQGSVFLKATGPKATIGGASSDFQKLLASIRPGGTSM
jgi:hypothetical protein